jgi:hypothetical protein
MNQGINNLMNVLQESGNDPEKSFVLSPTARNSSRRMKSFSLTWLGLISGSAISNAGKK